MKKLFFTAVAVLAFSGAGFAEGKESKVFRNSICREVGNSVYASMIGAGATHDQAMTAVWNAIVICNGNRT